MTQTDDARRPDWEGFGRDLLESWPVRDVDGSELFDAALRNGLIVEIPGGYDPDQHIDAEGICPEAGDPWYEYAFHPARADLATQPDPLADPRVWVLGEAAEVAAQFIHNRLYKPDMPACSYHSREISAAIRALIAQEDAAPTTDPEATP